MKDINRLFTFIQNNKYIQINKWQMGKEGVLIISEKNLNGFNLN